MAPPTTPNLYHEGGLGIVERLTQIARSNLGHIASRQFASHQPRDDDLKGSEPTAEGGVKQIEVATREAEYYANLELPIGAPYRDIKQAYRMLMRKYHPDLHSLIANKSEIADKITKQLNEAMRYFEQLFRGGGAPNG